MIRHSAYRWIGAFGAALSNKHHLSRFICCRSASCTDIPMRVYNMQSHRSTFEVDLCIPIDLLPHFRENFETFSIKKSRDFFPLKKNPKQKEKKAEWLCKSLHACEIPVYTKNNAIEIWYGWISNAIAVNNRANWNSLGWSTCCSKTIHWDLFRISPCSSWSDYRICLNHPTCLAGKSD